MVQLKDTILVLRYSRLGRIPPAQYATEILQESGLPVLVVEYGNFKENKKFLSESIPKLRLDAPLLRFLPTKFHSVTWVFSVSIRLSLLFLNRGRPKFIVAHGSSEQFIAWVLSRLFFVPYVIHAHEVFQEADVEGGFSRFLLKMEKWIFRGTSFSIFPGKKRAEVYQDKYQFKSPIFIAANTPRKRGVPKPLDLRAAYHLPKDSLIMGYVGGLGATNLLDLAVQALSLCPKVVFLVWGWGEKLYLEKLHALAHVFKVTDRFKYLGHLTDRKLETLAGCDLSYCVYHPGTLRLNYGAEASNKFFEAMAAGIPSIISSNPDFFDFNQQFSVGVCAPSLTTEGIAKAIQMVQRDPALRKRLGSNARKLFETRFHYEHQFTKPLQAYQDLFYGFPELWRANHVYFPPQDLPKAA